MGNDKKASESLGQLKGAPTTEPSSESEPKSSPNTEPTSKKCDLLYCCSGAKPLGHNEPVAGSQGEAMPNTEPTIPDELDEPEQRKEVNKKLHDKIFSCLMGNMTMPQARVQATTMMYIINSHLSAHWSPKEAYCHATQIRFGEIVLCDRDIRHEGEHSWQLVDKIIKLEQELAQLQTKQDKAE